MQPPTPPSEERELLTEVPPATEESEFNLDSDQSAEEVQDKEPDGSRDSTSEESPEPDMSNTDTSLTFNTDTFPTTPTDTLPTSDITTAQVTLEFKLTDGELTATPQLEFTVTSRSKDGDTDTSVSEED